MISLSSSSSKVFLCSFFPILLCLVTRLESYDYRVDYLMNHIEEDLDNQNKFFGQKLLAVFGDPYSKRDEEARREKERIAREEKERLEKIREEERQREKERIERENQEGK